jgi:hypothetical protein
MNRTKKGNTKMRFMVIVKASKNSEAGVMPSEQLLTEMGKFNEELTKAGVARRGRIAAQFEGSAGQLLGRETDGERRAIRRDQRVGRRLLALAVQVAARGD